MAHSYRDLGTKNLQSTTLPGQSVSVHTEQLASDTVEYKITATLGAYTEAQIHSIGANGTNPTQGPPMTAVALQAAVDGYRQVVADNVAWHAAMDAATNAIL